jgi:uncharacterized protein with ParB-like and HNH nuclease domain
MSKLTVIQKTIFNLLSDKDAFFLIPDYQRPYAWDEEQCKTLWDDIFAFAFPNNNAEEFNEGDEEYFLGSIVSYKNENKKFEIIDGQQRLTTTLLILRAFYDKFSNMQDDISKKMREKIEACIWKTNVLGVPDKSVLKIDSEVATDDDKQEFLNLLTTGVVVPGSKSQYVKNYQFFQKQIDSFLQGFASYFALFPARFLERCIFLAIEAESQDAALRIFSTLNDRGRPLSDGDIFKSQLYKNYRAKGRKDEFIDRWKLLEEVASSVFGGASSSSMDELFTRYMYYLRAKEKNKASTTEALRKFYERNGYSYLTKEGTLDDLEVLADFWKKISVQNREYFSERALKKLFVLNYAPNGMWQNITSVYFMVNRGDNRLDDNLFCEFLDKITAFIFVSAIANPGVNALRTPIYDEMINLIDGKELSFSKYKFNEQQTRSMFENYSFGNQRSITRSLLTWYAFTYPNQQLLDLKHGFDIEHIYPKKRQEFESGLKSEGSLESLGNKVILEDSINIRASDFRFEDKKAMYLGMQRRGKNKEASKIDEINELVKLESFDESQIQGRSKKILDKFFNFLSTEGILSDVGEFNRS